MACSSQIQDPHPPDPHRHDSSPDIPHRASKARFNRITGCNPGRLVFPCRGFTPASRPHAMTYDEFFKRAAKPSRMNPDQPHRDHTSMEGFAAGAQAAASVGGDTSQRGSEHDVRGGAGGHSHPSRNPRPDRAARCVEAGVGVCCYSELDSQLAERVTRKPKANVLLRVFANCATIERRDPNAECWWDASNASFFLSVPNTRFIAQ
jgi:hypothetical protein